MNKILQLSAFVLSISLLVPVVSAQNMNFTATLSGKDQVPAVETFTTGQATFQLSSGGDSLSYTLSVAYIEEASAAHIHLAAAGKNGPPVVVLYPTEAYPVRNGYFGGILARGTITAASLVGPLSGKTLAGLLEQMRAGNTYVNVHTKAHAGGEIRGQIE